MSTTRRMRSSVSAGSSVAVALTVPRIRPVIATVAPSAASWRANTLPMPRLAGYDRHFAGEFEIHEMIRN